MKEQQKHIDAFEEYFTLRQSDINMSKRAAMKSVSDKFGVNIRTVERWASAFDWNGKEAIRNHAVNTVVQEKTNNALAENKAWYLRNLHEAIKSAESRNSITIENMNDYEKATKLALTIQGDDEHDSTEVTNILRGIIEALRENTGGIESIGVKSRFDSKDKSES